MILAEVSDSDYSVASPTRRRPQNTDVQAMATVLSDQVAAILRSCSAPEALKTWLETEQLKDVDDVALLCKDEEKVERRFVNLIQPPSDGGS